MPLKRNSPTLARLVEGTIGVSNYFRCKYTTNISILQEYEQKRYRNYKNAPTNKSRVPRHKQTGQTLAANKVPIGKFTDPEP